VGSDPAGRGALGGGGGRGLACADCLFWDGCADHAKGFRRAAIGGGFCGDVPTHHALALSFGAAPEEVLKGGIKAVVVIELSAGQMVEDVRLALGELVPVELCSYVGGTMPTRSEVRQHVLDTLSRYGIEQEAGAS